MYRIQIMWWKWFSLSSSFSDECKRESLPNKIVRSDKNIPFSAMPSESPSDYECVSITTKIKLKWKPSDVIPPLLRTTAKRPCGHIVNESAILLFRIEYSFDACVQSACTVWSIVWLFDAWRCAHQPPLNVYIYSTTNWADATRNMKVHWLIATTNDMHWTVDTV